MTLVVPNPMFFRFVSFQISGREMFEFNPDLIAGDDDEADDFVYEREQDEVGNKIAVCPRKYTCLFLCFVFNFGYVISH